jgi:hypothetical protein
MYEFSSNLLPSEEFDFVALGVPSPPDMQSMGRRQRSVPIKSAEQQAALLLHRSAIF